MSRITRDPSSGRSIQCLAKITVMVLSCPLTWTKYFIIILIVSRNYIFVHLLHSKVLLIFILEFESSTSCRNVGY